MKDVYELGKSGLTPKKLKSKEGKFEITSDEELWNHIGEIEKFTIFLLENYIRTLEQENSKN